MKFFAKSTFEYIRNKVEQLTITAGGNTKLLIMIPLVRAQVAVKICRNIDSYCTEHSPRIKAYTKIAKELCDEWAKSNNHDERDAFQEAKDKGWYDSTGNLTGLRNAPPDTNSSITLILLIGTAIVTDSSSLSDFHKCDVETIWVECLKKSFAPWISQRFKESSLSYEDNNIKNFNSILIPLVEQGFADILKISSHLEAIDLAAAQDGRDAEKVLLESFGAFGLPRFSNYQFTGRTKFGVYVEDAIAFFSYDMFREERARKKALDTIEKFVSRYEENIEKNECFEENERRSFNTDKEFINGLRAYINTDDQNIFNLLRDCDFVVIRDRILKFKERKERIKTEKIKKLSGGLVEILLHALWITLGDFKRIAKEKGVTANETLQKVSIEASLYRHDSEGESQEERQRRARAYINRLTGGVDELIRQNVNLSAVCGSTREITVESNIEKNNVACQHARTSEPNLEFDVTIYAIDWEEPIIRTFAWRLPKIHQYRLADDLILWAVKSLNESEGTCKLPVFNVPYYEELLLAQDDEETRRVLMQCVQDEGGKIFNLLNVQGINEGGALLSSLKELAINYVQFLVTAKQNGLHESLNKKWIPLRKAYEKVCSLFLTDPKCANSPLAPMLMRAFLIIKKRNAIESDRWVWEPYEQSGIVTVLHPALIEMLESHIQYLFVCFNMAVTKEFRASASRSFQEGVWQSYVDLAAIQMPLTGLIRDSNRILDTNIRGENLIHRIGCIGQNEASLTTRLLLRYEDFEDEEISDAEIFRETRDSKLLYRIMNDYYKLHPHAKDGLSIAVYRNKDIQPVIAAVDAYLRGIASDKNIEDDFYKSYAMSVTIFTESSDDTSIMRWIEQWRERWEAAETESKFGHYRKTQLSVSNRIVSSEAYYRQFKELIDDGLEIDIVFLNDFICAGSEGNDFEPVAPYDVTSLTLKFPILEKSFCALRDPGRQLQRARILSNRQFRLSSLHAEIMARLKHQTTPLGKEHIVLGYGDYTPWQGVIDVFHKRAEWVVCIDPNMDERLIKNKVNTIDVTREIIGFGSGVGSHGESNFTISTEQFALSDVLHRLKASIAEIYASWSAETCEKVAKSVLKEACKLSGLSMVRATGIGDYMRDFMAYSLARRILQAENGVLCDQLISLDAYRHWFDTAETGTRPDLIWLVAKIGDNGRIHLDLRIIECKQAKYSEEHLEKARQQVESGLRHLIPVFMPRDDSIEDYRPDQRYWWLQLHRLLASKAEITKAEQPKVLAALEWLASGDYSITWSAAVLAFWTDIKSSEIICKEEWPFEIEGRNLSIGVFHAGSDYIKRVCCEEKKENINWPKQTVSFMSMVPNLDDEDDDGGHQEVEKGDDETPKKSIDVKPEAEKSIKEEVNNRLELMIDVHKGRESIPGRIFLGTAVKGSRQVYWEFGHKELNNRHMLIFGSSGMGKTYTIQCLLCELGKVGQNSLIIDYTNGFSENHLEQGLNKLLNPVQHIVRREPLPINPFRRLDEVFGKERVCESVISTAQRAAGVFAEVYTLGEQQKASLYTAIKNGLEGHVENNMSLDMLVQQLRELEDSDAPEGRYAGTIISKITPFVDMNPFGPEQEGSWDRLFKETEHRCHILQLVGFMRDSWRLIVEFALIDLYAYYRVMGSQDKPRVVVLDEVQNLDQREDSPLAQLLREGRKFGFSLILATQIMSNLQKDERDRLFNAGHKLFFRPADTEMRSYADIAAVSTGEDVNEWIRRLAQLQKGECYSLGPSKNDVTCKLETKAFRIKIASLEDRGFNG